MINELFKSSPGYIVSYSLGSYEASVECFDVFSSASSETESLNAALLTDQCSPLRLQTTLSYLFRRPDMKRLLIR